MFRLGYQCGFVGGSIGGGNLASSFVDEGGDEVVERGVRVPVLAPLDKAVDGEGLDGLLKRIDDAVLLGELDLALVGLLGLAGFALAGA